MRSVPPRGSGGVRSRTFTKMRPGRALPTRCRRGGTDLMEPGGLGIAWVYYRAGWVSPGFTIARAEYRAVVLQREAAVERTVLAGTGPRTRDYFARVARFYRVADFAVLEADEWLVPDEVRHLAAKIVGHCFDVDGCIVRRDVVSAARVVKSDRRRADGHNVAECRSVLHFQSGDHCL